MSDEIIERWHQKGFKPTSQRLLIYEILARSKNHPSAEDIWKTARKSYPVLSLNTVYKTLNALVEIDEAIIVDAGTPMARYEVNLVPHQHFLCRKCGKIIDLFMPDIKPPVIPDKYRNEFDLIGFQINYYGYCKNCRKKGGKARKGNQTQ